MTSTGLPGKVLKEVLNKPLLEYQIERLRRVTLADEIVIATPKDETSDPIIDLCQRLATPSFRGSEHDVLARYYGAAKDARADVIVRVTSDCPLIDPSIIDRIIQRYLEDETQYDYVSNCLERSYPRGMDTEVFPFRVLEEAFSEATDSRDREHVTPFLYRQPERYRLGHVTHPRDQSHHRWTVDTPEDFELIRKILEALYPERPEFTLEDCLDLLEQHPSWSKINAHVAQLRN